MADDDKPAELAFRPMTCPACGHVSRWAQRSYGSVVLSKPPTADLPERRIYTSDMYCDHCGANLRPPRYPDDDATELLAAITASHFTAGIVLKPDKRGDWRVVVAADIVRYMRGWTRRRVRWYCKEKGWHVAVVTETRTR